MKRGKPNVILYLTERFATSIRIPGVVGDDDALFKMCYMSVYDADMSAFSGVYNVYLYAPDSGRHRPVHPIVPGIPHFLCICVYHRSDTL